VVWLGVAGLLLAAPFFAQASGRPALIWEDDGPAGAVLSLRWSDGAVGPGEAGAEREATQRSSGLLVLPPGAALSAVLEAPEGVRVGEPMRLGGLQVVPVTWERSGTRAGDALRLAVETGSAPEGTIAPGRGALEALQTLGEGVLWSFDAAEMEPEVGLYLVVSAPEFVQAVQPLVAWKREKGYAVEVVTTDETGSLNTEIRDYIAERYQEGDVPLQYVLLVGDVEQIPGFDYHSSVSDHPYSLVDGDDFLPDLDVGRLSASTVEEVETIVAKMVGYEKDPLRSGDTGWFRRGLVVAGDYGSSTPRPVSRWCREQLLEIGFTEVDSVYFPPHWSTGVPLIRAAINDGVSIVSYRGWAYGTLGWEPPHFTSNEIPSLENGWMLPAVFSFVCQNNDFTEPACFGEVWLRVGDAQNPKGAIAFIGNSEPWSHTRFNDAAAIGAFQAIRRGVWRLGPILTASKMEILHQFPGEIPYDEYEDESAEFYFYIYSLLGDPEMNLWLETPRALAVAFPDTIAYGTDALAVTVLLGDTSEPVEGALVGVSAGAERVGAAYTDASGLAMVPVAFDSAGVAFRVTVTGRGLLPFQGDGAVVAPGIFLACDSVVVRDGLEGSGEGNGDGRANPGETLALVPRLENTGTAEASAPWVRLEVPAGVEAIVDSVLYPDIPAGEAAEPSVPFQVRVLPGVRDGQRLEFVLRSDAGPSESRFTLAVEAPDLVVATTRIEPGGVLAQGDTLDIYVALRNDGSADAGDVTGHLETLTGDLVSVVKADAAFGAIARGEAVESSTAFRVFVSSQAASGQAAVFRLTASDGQSWQGQISFSLSIGQADHTAPTGPDAYGYYAYDNSDTDYPGQVPLFQWIPCSPRFGGQGTRIELGDAETALVDLPFSFTFYGKSYDQIRVSDNGWISFDTADYYDYYNWHIPTTYGNGAVIAAYWDNLDPSRSEDGDLPGDGIYVWHDEANHRFVVEWSLLGHFNPDLDDLQTFELILYDPAHYPTQTGDGIVEVQYKQVFNNDATRMYATVGIENEDETVGLEYTYANFYPETAAPLSGGLAIRFTTEKPVYQPLVLKEVRAERTPAGILVSWKPGDDRPLGGFRILRADGSGREIDASGRLLPADARQWLDTEADPEDAYTYRIVVLDPVGREAWEGRTDYPTVASIPGELRVRLASGNPVSGPLGVVLEGLSEGAVRLDVYDVAGRLVRRLFQGPVRGEVTLVWDGRDTRGRPVGRGTYFLRLEGSGTHQTRKLLVLR
jgi:hypothetical protein